MSVRARILALSHRTARLGRWLLVAASITAALAGVTLALGQARIHTLMVYGAVALAAAGTVLALPAAMATNPLSTEESS